MISSASTCAAAAATAAAAGELKLVKDLRHQDAAEETGSDIPLVVEIFSVWSRFSL